MSVVYYYYQAHERNILAINGLFLKCLIYTYFMYTFTMYNQSCKYAYLCSLTISNLTRYHTLSAKIVTKPKHIVHKQSKIFFNPYVQPLLVLFVGLFIRNRLWIKILKSLAPNSISEKVYNSMQFYYAVSCVVPLHLFALKFKNYTSLHRKQPSIWDL